MKMNKMTVIQLLNKIANGEEVPKKINFCMRNFEYKKDIDDYLCIDENFDKIEDYCLGVSICKWIFSSMLNSEVEILDDEEKKVPEQLGYQNNADKTFYLNRKKYNSEPIKILSEKVNEIIDYLDYLEKQRKGE